MNLWLRSITSLIFTILFPLWALAGSIIEARVHYGALVSAPEIAPLYTGSLTIPSLAANYGMGADLIFSPPLASWGIGIRQENLGLTASSGGLDLKSTASRTGAILTYRFIDTFLHFGTILTYGLSHTGGFEVKETSGLVDLNWKPESISSYSAGLEASIGLGLFLIGAEVGYQNLQWNKMKDSTGTSTDTPNTNMSGTYTKLYLGVGI